MRTAFAEGLCCPHCGDRLKLETRVAAEDCVSEGALTAPCGRIVPIIDGLPRILPSGVTDTLLSQHSAFFERHRDLRPAAEHGAGGGAASLRTLHAFGDEWRRFPELMKAHEAIFRWYFEGPDVVRWKGLKVLDAGCGMGRWLHFASCAGAEVVGMDVSQAVDVAAAREGAKADFVQADLRWPPFTPASFDLVYSLGVVHHLEDPLAGVQALARLVRPGGELRLYVYRTLDDESRWTRGLFAAVTGLRRITTRLPYPAVHFVAWLIAVTASALILWPRRLLRLWPGGDRMTRGLPLVHYTDVPFRMLVAEQFDRLVAPIEGRFTRDEVAGWLRKVGLEVVAILPGLGWRAIGRKPS